MKLDLDSVAKVKEEISYSKRPLIFFHDDADGVCSFLQFYKFLGGGQGVIVKSNPRIDEKFLKKVHEYQPDKVFIVDIATVDQEFIDQAGCKVVWVDHHDPLKRENVLYLNPRVHKTEFGPAASWICWQITKQDVWSAMAGCVGDWQLLPDLAKEFRKQYPDLLPEGIDRPEQALFDSPVGKIAQMINFSLKGGVKDAMQCVKILTRISSPYELLEGNTPQSEFIHKKIKPFVKEYEGLLKRIEKAKQKSDKMHVFTYKTTNNSFSGELSNETLYRRPDKVIIIAREKNDEMRSSLRSAGNVLIAPILAKALTEVEGFGGGHPHACGACIKKKDWKRFLKIVEASL